MPELEVILHSMSFGYALKYTGRIVNSELAKQSALRELAEEPKMLSMKYKSWKEDLNFLAASENTSWRDFLIAWSSFESFKKKLIVGKLQQINKICCGCWDEGDKEENIKRASSFIDLLFDWFVDFLWWLQTN